MLRDEAMIVRLSISQWSARKFDKIATQKVADDYGTKADVGRYNKVLIAKEAIQDVTRAVSAARTYHYEHTLPWDDSGARILTAACFMEYSKRMRELREEFEAAVSKFASNYSTYRDEAEMKLAGLFNPGDYPGVNEIRDRYTFTTDIEPVPSGSDFRVSVQAKDAERIKKDIENRVNDRVKTATDDLYKRLADVTGKFADKLKEGGVFRDSLVGNVVDLVSLLPKLNIAGDEKLEALRKEIELKIAGSSPDVLRNDEAVKAKAVKDADAILKKMAAYTG